MIKPVSFVTNATVTSQRDMQPVDVLEEMYLDR